MKLCYLVYREDNVMVFESQVLEYLQNLKANTDIEQIELLVFRHGEKKAVEERIHHFIDKCKTFSSFRVLSIAQLKLNAARLKRYITKAYGKQEEIAVICRGELSTFVAAKAFKNFPNSRILFDNRGLPIEESEMRCDSFLHKLNRKMKKRVLLFAKAHCDMYNFVTDVMRDYYIEKYSYIPTLPYTVIPTLYKAQPVDAEGLNEIIQNENYSPDDVVVSYVGSTEVWQSAEQLVEMLKNIGIKYPNVRFFVLTNGTLPNEASIPEEVRARITVKNVLHHQIKYYLAMTDWGIVIRDDNIVNRVAAPTKIAEYLTNGVRILYSGDIGILSDLKNRSIDAQMINVETETDWLDRIGEYDKSKQRSVSGDVINYFDMRTRQKETLDMIANSFKNIKVR